MNTTTQIIRDLGLEDTPHTANAIDRIIETFTPEICLEDVVDFVVQNGVYPTDLFDQETLREFVGVEETDYSKMSDGWKYLLGTSPAIAPFRKVGMDVAVSTFQLMHLPTGSQTYGYPNEPKVKVGPNRILVDQDFVILSESHATGYSTYSHENRPVLVVYRGNIFNFNNIFEAAEFAAEQWANFQGDLNKFLEVFTAILV